LEAATLGPDRAFEADVDGADDDSRPFGGLEAVELDADDDAGADEVDPPVAGSESAAQAAMPAVPPARARTPAARSTVRRDGTTSGTERCSASPFG
jgi:hypothetical protein